MYALLGLYVVCSATGLTLLKVGVSKGIVLKFTSGIVDFEFSWILPLGMMIYATSFLLSLTAMSKMELHYFYPISAGLIYILVFVLSVFVLKEAVDLKSMVGIAIILIGVVVMNWSK